MQIAIYQISILRIFGDFETLGAAWTKQTKSHENNAAENQSAYWNSGMVPGRTLFAANPQIGGTMNASTIIIILLIVLLVAALPSWPYSSGWGYYPSGGLGFILLILIILLLLGKL